MNAIARSRTRFAESVADPCSLHSQDEIIAFLERIEPFRRLKPQDLQRAAASARVRTIWNGEQLYSEGGEVASMWVLMAGRIEILRYTSDSKPRAIETVFPGQLFGTVYNRLEGARTYPNSAVAYIDSQVIELPFSEFVYLLHNSLPFVTGLCSLYSQRIGEMQECNSRSQEPVAKRIARTLVELFGRSGRKLNMTRREIAELAGTTVETSIRTLIDFEKRRWVITSRGQIVLLDLAGMREFSVSD